MMSSTAQQSTPHAANAHGNLVEGVLEETERSFALLSKQATIALRSRYLADGIGDDNQAITIAMIGAELGIGPMTALREIHLIPGKGGKLKPALSSQLKHALAVKRVPGFKLEFLQADARGCIVLASRASSDKPQRFAWTEEDSRKAGLLSPTGSGHPSNHVKFPSQMFLARAVSMAVDAIAPEACMGFPSIEQVQDEAHVDRIAALGILPTVGASSGRDSAPDAKASEASPTPPGLKSLAELWAILDDAHGDVGALESFRDTYKPDRLALSKDDRQHLAAEWTKRYLEAGGKPGRALAAKSNAEAAARAPAPEAQAVEGEGAAPSGGEEAAKRSRRMEEIVATTNSAEGRRIALLGLGKP